MNKEDNNKHILILGGYGTFGSRIARALCHKGYQVTINGRHFHKAQSLKHSIMREHITAKIKVSCFDVNHQLAVHLNKLKPAVVIHTCGPFQGQDTNIAKTILKAGAHCIDLADSRDYVRKMRDLDDLAKTNDITAITAASTVPTLSSAVLKHLQQTLKIKHFQQVKIGISPGQKTPRGLATTEAVLSYIGRPLKSWDKNSQKKYGWSDTHLQTYPKIQDRLMSLCEAPDLDLLPKHFDIWKLTFSAGMESRLLHRLIELLAWCIKIGLPIKPEKHALKLLKASRWFDRFGSHDGGMHVSIKAKNDRRETIDKTWFIEAFDNDGPQIPAIPAIIMTDKILNSNYQPGVRPCVGLISLEEYLKELAPLNITTNIL